MSRRIQIAWLDQVAYASALELQEALREARLAEQIPDTLLTLEHPHTFTLGRGASERNLRAPVAPVFRVSRGGEVTYHGPGQLVGYAILKLEGAQRDVHAYLRHLEQAQIEALAEVGIAAMRRPGLTGVWVGERKIGSIGVGIRRWVTAHGFALNVSPELRYFDAIIPCGIHGCRMTSARAEGAAISVPAMAALVGRKLCQILAYEQLELAEPQALWRLCRTAGEAQIQA